MMTDDDDIVSECDAELVSSLADTEDDKYLERVAALYLRVESEYTRVMAASKAMLAALDSNLRGYQVVLFPRVREILERRIAAQVAQGKKAPPKFIQTIKGRLGLRTIPGRMEVTAPEKIVQQWMSGTIPPECVETKQVVSLEKLQTYIATTGDVPDGVEQTEPHEVLYCKAAFKQE